MANNLFVNIPGIGSASWRAPVATATDLPANGNNLGDAIVTDDTSVIYVWNGTNWVTESSAGGVTSLNTLTGSLSLTGSGGVVITPSGTTIDIGISGAGTGTVTSVGLVDGSSTPIFGISGSPVTTNGNLTFTLENQNKNLVFAGPTTGSAAQPEFRSLILTDFPSIANNTVLGNTSGGSSTPIAQSLGTVTEATSAVLTLTDWSNATLGSPTITVTQSSTSTSGYLSSTDWNIFNNKQNADNYITALTGDATASGPGSAALTLATVNTNVGSFTNGAFTVNAKGLITAASSGTTGNITSTPTTNLVITGGTGAVLGSGTLLTLTGASIVEATSSVLTLTGATNAVLGTGVSIQVKQSSTSQSGYLSSTDWNTFNGKQSTLTFSDSLVNTLGTVTLVNDSATPGNSKYYGTNSSGTLGYFSVPSAGSGTVTSVTFTGDGTVLSSTPSSAVTTSGTVTGTLLTQVKNTILAGPTTGSNATPTFRALVGADLPLPSASTLGGIESLSAVTSRWINTISTAGVPSATQPAFTDISGNLILSQFPSIANNTVLGNVSGVSAVPVALTATQLTTIPNVFTSSLQGMVPASSGGTLNFLRADGTFASPPSGFANPMTTLGDIIYENAVPAPVRLAGNTTSTKNFLVQTGTGAVSAAPAWGTIANTDLSGITNAQLSGSAAITNANLATMVNNTIKGNTSGITATPSDLSLGTVTEATSAVLTLTGWTDATIGSPTITVKQSSTTVSGYLSSTDWNIFNGKQASGNYITALTGDITASGPGSVTATLATVNSNVGSFGSSTSIPSFTVNAKGLITAASGNVVIAPAGTLTGTTLNSTVVTSSLTSLGTQGQALNMGSHLINNVTDPSGAQDAATKNYVDTAVAAFQPQTSVYVATVGNNIAGSYLNGVAGVGATFTTTSTSTFTLDGISPPILSRILIKDQSSGFQNGIYTFTTLPIGGVSGSVFTRSLDYDDADDMNSAGLIPVINGTLNALSSWQQVATITTVGTDSLVFTEFTANPSLYLLKANNLSDVSSKTTSFNTISPITTTGDLIYSSSGTTNVRLGIGSTGNVLTVSGGIPTWSPPATAGTVTSVAMTVPTFLSVTGSPLTSSGTLAVTLSGTALPIANGGTAGTSAAAAFSNLSPITTTGDIIYSSTGTTNSRLPIGSTGNVLTVSGGVPSWAPPATSGTVTSVAFTDASTTPIFTVTGSPVTSTGTLTNTLKTQTANLIFAGPSSGSAAQPTFRSLVGADLPVPSASTLGGIESLAAVTSRWINTISTSGVPSATQPAFTDISGNFTLAQFPSIATNTVLGNVSGSTGVPSALTATQLTTIPNTFTSLLQGMTPSSGGGTTNFLRADGTWAAPAGGAGTVTSVAMTVPTFLSITGSPITGSGTLAVTLSGTALPILNGGTGQTTATAAFSALSPITTTGDLIYSSSATTNSRLAIGSTNNVLTVIGGVPSWQPPATAGTVTSVAMTVPTFLSVSGSPITSAGTLAVTLSGTALPILNGGTGVTAITTVPTAGDFAAWDTNANMSADNFIHGFRTQATAAGTTTLTVGDVEQQFFTGITTQIVKLPVATTMVNGQGFKITNLSSGIVTLETSGSNVVQAMVANTELDILCVNTAGGTGTASWSWSYYPLNGGTVTSIAMTVPTFLSVSGSPITNSGTLGITLSGSALPIANGGTAVTSVTTTPTASTFAGWDANNNLSANNHIESFTSITTAAGTTTLSVSSANQQYFTGSTTQTVKMPVVTTLVNGFNFQIANLSAGVVTVQSSGTNTIQAMASNTMLNLTCNNTAGGTGIASWTWEYFSVDATLPLTNPMTTGGDLIIGGASGAPTRLANGTAGQVLSSAGGTSAETWATIPGNATVLKAPTAQTFNSTGTQTGILITLTTASITATAGATYTNNTNTYTLLNSPAASTGPIYFSGTGTTSGTTFTKASGTGNATIVANAAINIQTLATYTTPTNPSPLYINPLLAGGGGGGGGGNVVGVAGTSGTATAFITAANVIIANGGSGGLGAGNGGAGGTASLGTGPIGKALTGSTGSAPSVGNLGSTIGGNGGNTPYLLGGGSCQYPGSLLGIAGTTNTGGGGSGGNNQAAGVDGAGAGGGSGGFINCLITSSISATYFYTIGTGGAGAAGGTSGGAGGTGASGTIIIYEHYQ